MLGEWFSLRSSAAAGERAASAARGRHRSPSRASDPASRNDRPAALDREREDLARDLARRWAVFQALCFVIPLVGCLLSLWNLEVVPGPFPFREVGWPAIIAVAETLPLAVLVAAVARNGRVLLDQWWVFAEVSTQLEAGEDATPPSPVIARPLANPPRGREPSGPHPEVREPQPERPRSRLVEPTPGTRDPKLEQLRRRPVEPPVRAREPEPEGQRPQPHERAIPLGPPEPEKTSAPPSWPEGEPASSPDRSRPRQQAPAATEVSAVLPRPSEIPPVIKDPVVPKGLEEEMRRGDSDDADEPEPDEPRKKVEPRKRPDEDYY
jgi:hypothetical protein